MSEQALLVCKREEALTPEQAASTKSVKEKCEYCGHTVWVVPRNLILREAKGCKIACQECTREMTQAELAKGEPVTETPAKPHAEEAWENLTRRTFNKWAKENK